MSEAKTNNGPMLRLWPRLERLCEPLAPRWRFVKRLGTNVGIAVLFIGVSLFIGMVCYHWLEGLNWLQSFGHAAMILGGMGPYTEPVNNSSKLFEGIYALYSGLLLVGVTGLILTPIIHRVMHAFHLPDDEGDQSASAPKRAKSPPAQGAKRRAAKPVS
jgi:hypothetical protein